MEARNIMVVINESNLREVDKRTIKTILKDKHYRDYHKRINPELATCFDITALRALLHLNSLKEDIDFDIEGLIKKETKKSYKELNPYNI